jgi:hypothetical protein
MRKSNWLHSMSKSNFDRLPNWLTCKFDRNWLRFARQVIKFKSGLSWVKSLCNKIFSLTLNCVGFCVFHIKIAIGRDMVDVTCRNPSFGSRPRQGGCKVAGL